MFFELNCRPQKVVRLPTPFLLKSGGHPPSSDKNMLQVPQRYFASVFNVLINTRCSECQWPRHSKEAPLTQLPLWSQLHNLHRQRKYKLSFQTLNAPSILIGPRLTPSWCRPLQALVVLDYRLIIVERTAAVVQLGRRGGRLGLVLRGTRVPPS